LAPRHAADFGGAESVDAVDESAAGLDFGGLAVRYSHRGEDVVATFDRVCRTACYPKTIRVDQGSDFVSRDMDAILSSAFSKGSVLKQAMLPELTAVGGRCRCSQNQNVRTSAG